MVWCIEVELGGQVQADRYLLTGGPLPGPREVTVGRPPAKAAVRPDIVVKEPSVSKIHAILSVEHAVGEQQGPALVLKGRTNATTKRTAQSRDHCRSIMQQGWFDVKHHPALFAVVMTCRPEPVRHFREPGEGAQRGHQGPGAGCDCGAGGQGALDVGSSLPGVNI